MGQALEKTDMPRSVQMVATDAAALMEVISRVLADPRADVDKLERVAALYERLKAKDAEQIFSDAMTACQEEMRPVAQDANNPQTKSKYASYKALDLALRPTYTKHGFNISFTTGDGAPPDYVRNVAIVRHRVGHVERYQLDIPADGKGAKGGDVMTKTHATMSAVQYGRRGLLKMVFNIAEGTFDDDGNAAGGGRISQELQDELSALIRETKADERKFLELLGVAALYEIPASKFGQAKQRLLDRKAKMEKANARS